MALFPFSHFAKTFFAEFLAGEFGDEPFDVIDWDSNVDYCIPAATECLFRAQLLEDYGEDSPMIPALCGLLRLSPAASAATGPAGAAHRSSFWTKIRPDEGIYASQHDAFRFRAPFFE